MREHAPAKIAIVDYGMGNLFSVKQACAHAGVQADITNDKEVIIRAAGVILPGIGAFRDAMETLRKCDLVGTLRDVVASGRPFMGICLGMQLLMTESYEFGRHRGLGIIEGDVVRLHGTDEQEHPLKVPNIGWSRLCQLRSWKGSVLEDVGDASFMYFVHSYYVRPVNSSAVLSTSRFGQLEFCSSLSQGAVFACQFHPERSGRDGLTIYRRFAAATIPVTVE